MSLINKKVSEFKVQAYQNGDFKEVTLADIIWSFSHLKILLTTSLLHIKLLQCCSNVGLIISSLLFYVSY